MECDNRDGKLDINQIDCKLIQEIKIRSLSTKKIMQRNKKIIISETTLPRVSSGSSFIGEKGHDFKVKIETPGEMVASCKGALIQSKFFIEINPQI